MTQDLEDAMSLKCQLQPLRGNNLLSCCCVSRVLLRARAAASLWIREEWDTHGASQRGWEGTHWGLMGSQSDWGWKLRLGGTLNIITVEGEIPAEAVAGHTSGAHVLL